VVWAPKMKTGITPMTTVIRMEPASMVSIKVTPRSDSALLFRQGFPGLIPVVLGTSPAIFNTPEF
jgi:hypothetical protein